MSITPVPELERLLDAKQKAGARMREAFQTGMPFARLRVEHDRAWSDLEYALTDDTLRALLDVAEAVRYHLEDACGDCAIRFCEDDSDIGCSLDDMRTALAPLVK